MDWIIEAFFRPRTLFVIAAIVIFNMHNAWLKKRYHHGKPVAGEPEWREIAVDPWHLAGTIMVTMFAVLMAGGFAAFIVFGKGSFPLLKTLWIVFISGVFLVYSIVEWRGIFVTKRLSIRHGCDSITYRSKKTAERVRRSITDITHYEDRFGRPDKIHFKDGAIPLSSNAWGASALRDQISWKNYERT